MPEPRQAPIVTRRPATSADTPFARQAHHGAYREVSERMFGPWDGARQDRFFADSWSQATHELILADAEPAGYCAIDWRAEDIHLRELVIAPSHQGRGIGTALVTALQSDARRLGQPIRLGTFHANRARELYARLGFVVIGRTETHLLMEWSPT